VLGFILLFLLVVVIAVPCVVAVRIWQVGHQDDRRPSETLIVLGAAQYNGKPAPVLEARLDHAIELYKEKVAPEIITLGSKLVGDKYTEAEAGRAYLIAHGVPSSAIIADQTGTDTFNSLQAAATTMQSHGWTTAVIVTDPWHSLRCRTMARDLGIDAVTSPTWIGPSVESRGTEIRYIARETFGYLYYVIGQRPGVTPIVTSSAQG
jgi:uncharacterized SAM-binding protein YcdF (DUF218 family)